MDTSSLQNAAAREVYTHQYVDTTVRATDPACNHFLKVKPGDKLINPEAHRRSVELMFNLAPTAPDRLLDIKNA